MRRSFVPRRQIVIAHRGASAYAPENTLPSYELALAQGADCVELDLHATSDGTLVCIHDRSLERTTNVRDVFPTRGHHGVVDGSVVHRWFVHDFTMAEIRTLDCGSWFGAQYAGATIQTFEDVLGWAKDRTSILAELKDPEAYEPLGVDLLSLFEAVVQRHGMANGPAPDRLMVQSFHEPTVRRAGSLYRQRMPVVFLRQRADAVQCTDPSQLAEIATFATGLGPEKSSLVDRPELVERAHHAGLRVTPWTFRASSPDRFDDVRAQMKYYLSDLKVDGVITDNPDQAAGLLD
jgi:glycerophosphoryl diester phosphodiesterase